MVASVIRPVYVLAVLAVHTGIPPRRRTVTHKGAFQLKYLPRGTVVVNTGKLYDEPHRQLASLPWWLGARVPGGAKTIVVSAADRKKLNIKCVDVVDVDKVTYDPDRVNKYRNNL